MGKPSLANLGASRPQLNMRTMTQGRGRVILTLESVAHLNIKIMT